METGGGKVAEQKVGYSQCKQSGQQGGSKVCDVDRKEFMAGNSNLTFVFNKFNLLFSVFGHSFNENILQKRKKLRLLIILLNY